MNKNPILSSEITPKNVYLNRREFMKSVGLLAGSLTLAACGIAPSPPENNGVVNTERPTINGETPNSLEEIINYNNYYEFTTVKERVAELSKNFKTSPWEVEVSGLVNKPGVFGVDELIKKFQPEERIYRLRCVEAWSMVIPWMGFSLSKLLAEIEPTSDAKFVRFETLYNPEEMPGQKQPSYPWPYQEGLRLDEAMNELTLLATGLYGNELPPQSGGGIRLVVPWKYGFKSIKAIVKIELTDYQPETLWNTIAPNEYGFYANVNPQVDHPRWSQRTERRIGEFNRRDTLLFNGYADQVAYLYEGMDLKENY